MPLFFFDIHDGFEIRDHEGADLPDRMAARAHAMQVAAAYLGAPPRSDVAGNGAIVVAVRDDRSRPALAVHLTFEIQEL